MNALPGRSVDALQGAAMWSPVALHRAAVQPPVFS
jgi:hypothetical protein